MNLSGKQENECMKKENKELTKGRETPLTPLISHSQAELITGKEWGSLVEYESISWLKSLICKNEMAMEEGAPQHMAVSSLKSLIFNEEIGAQSVAFLLPNNPAIAREIKAEVFADICKAFVEGARRRY